MSVPTEPDSAHPGERPRALADAAGFLREARALDAAEIIPLRSDPALAERNVTAGALAVLAYEAHVAEHLPAVDLGELRSLPALARRVVELAREIAGDGEAETTALLAEAHALRATLRAAALALVEAGALARKDVSKLGNDRGALDVAAECAMLGALFQRRAAELAGKSPVTEAQAARAAELAQALRAQQKPRGAAKKPGPDGVSPAELCDRLWSLLAMRHERLWAVGAYVFGHVVDDHVPPLSASATSRPAPSLSAALRPPRHVSSSSKEKPARDPGPG